MHWIDNSYSHIHDHLTALCPVLPGESQYQKGKTNLDFIEARDSERQWLTWVVPDKGPLNRCVCYKMK